MKLSNFYSYVVMKCSIQTSFSVQHIFIECSRYKGEWGNTERSGKAVHNNDSNSYGRVQEFSVLIVNYTDKSTLKQKKKIQ